ncbi:extracellular solute-binding protein [Demequina capsici]|uniref:Extracellular solute-binding protein n=1 Tax=Demequina capsici TaxID=3075620 RepID=A0AA96FBA0_9MICO|nr:MULTISPECIES: extracellular solute-binding protein [unclassified Demequina]WNM24255.1 extracellular solute-binding protein [Demequina sp. OYTSA14]WNM27084.1 extracellular solute-binding protein [Demequina sp. PMTSA13]
MNRRTILAGTTALVTGALLLTACSSDPGTDGASGDGAVTLTLWQNSTTGDGMQYWQDMADAFHEQYPNVTVEVQSIQNEDMDGKLQTALNSGDAPDIFMARGGGKLADVVTAGQVMDLTDKLSDATTSAMGAAMSAFTIDGKVYGVPTAVLPEGFFYSQDLFDAAGITSTPTTLSELSDDVTALKANGTDAIAVGAKDAWPAAHWYYNFALRECSQDTMNKAASDRTFDDDCWLRAGEDLQTFAATEPFNNGFLTTSAQQGAGSSAGLVANHQAAMELMGAWDPGVIASLTPDEQALPDLAWFPFPEIDGGDGTPGAMMSGADGYSCYVNAPAECVDFLDFIATKANQEAYAAAFQTIPASSEAQGAVTDPALTKLLEAYKSAPYVMLWLDTMYGQNVGNALNVAVVNMLAGSGTPQDIVDAVNSAALKG